MREEWLLGFSVFLKGTEEEQTEYCFKIYDINSDGFITREEMMTLMKSCLVRYLSSLIIQNPSSKVCILKLRHNDDFADRGQRRMTGMGMRG